MKCTVWLGLLALVGASIPGIAAPAPADLSFLTPQANSETVGTPRDPAARATEMKALQQRLAGSQAVKALAKPLLVRLTAGERARIDDVLTGRSQGKYLVGVAKAVGQTLDFAPARALDKRASRLSLGTAQGTGNGGFVWTAEVQVPGATALRLHLTGLDLGRGGELYVYNLAGQAFGPYTGRGPLGTGVLYTNTVFGETLRLQLRMPAGGATPKLTLSDVGVMGARFAVPRYQPQGAFDGDDLAALAKASDLCSRNADCVVNAACQSSSVVDSAKEAVASMLFAKDGVYYNCTGALIADTDSSTVIPHFLTAHHCIKTSDEAASLETYFDYETTCSNPTCTKPFGSTGDTVGSTIEVTGSSSDYSLLRLASTPVTADGITTYLGWTTVAIANTNNAALYRISHPNGSPQAYWEGLVSTTRPTCSGTARGDFIYSVDTLGATEGGSSGAPVLNSSGHIVGQLHGACGSNTDDVCDSTDNSTVDGAFAAEFPSLSPFLISSSGGCKIPGVSCTGNSQCCSHLCRSFFGVRTCA